MSKSSSGLTAVKAERLFWLVIVLLLVALVVDFIFVTNFIKSEAAKSEVLRLQAEATDSDIAKLKSANAWLKKNNDIVERTGAIVAESKLYQYQNQIIEDFNSYGRQTGIPVLGYSFSSSTLPANGATPPPAPTTPAAPAPATKAPPGVNSTTVTVTFGEQVNYQAFLNMLKLLEQNVTRMQVTDVSLSPDALNPQAIATPNITVIVYTR